jgi:hypothetical protein
MTMHSSHSQSISANHRRARTAPRKSRRGAALVEAAFMMPMFVILFYASLFAHNLSNTYIKSSQQARANAWAYAMANCGDTASDNVEVLPPVDTEGAGAATKISPMPDNPTSPPGNGNFLSGMAGTIFGDISGLFPNPNGSQSVQTNSLNWRMPNLYNQTDSGTTSTVKRSVTIDCNNVANDGGAVNTLILIGKSIANFF